MADAHDRLTTALADRYRIEHELGAGGMATVYLAEDLKHDRKVALKVLRPELSAILGAERFLAEIKTTANLQHPHILGLFDSGEADGLVFYVMPYVDGESLRDRLTRDKQLPVDEAVRIAREVADALEYAHQKGIVHRDIKPENVLLHGGHALVADFGIALAVSRSDGGTRMTETGMSLGTPHYMAPEQAMGEREITPKADIYALGCVLYEMLTAEPPFVGATAQAIIARVMTEEPRSLTLQRKSIPPHVEAAVRTALEKLPADRFASAADFARALDRPDFAGPATRAVATAAGRVGPVAASQQLVRGLPWALVTAALVWVGWLATHRPRPVPPPTVAFDLAFGPRAAAVNASGSPLAFSPDGSRIAYVGTDSSGTRQLFVRSLDRVDPVPVAGTVQGDRPFFSPDGAWLGFVQEGKIRKVALAGGAVVTICDVTRFVGGVAWGAGDVIVYSELPGGLHQVSAAGGRPADLAQPDSTHPTSYRWPAFLPDGRAVVFTNVTDSGPSLWAVTLGDGRVRPLDQPGMSPQYVDGGYLVYTEQDGTVFARGFDAGKLRFTGPPQPIVGGVDMGGAAVAKMAVARTGALVYRGGDRSDLRELALVDRDGRALALPAPRAAYREPRFSRDGRRIAVTIAGGSSGPSGGGDDVWIWDLDAGNLQRITFDSASATPEWLPGGRRLVYTQYRGTNRLFTISPDGSGQPESLITRPNPIFESSPTPDGRAVVFREISEQRNRDIWIATLDSPQVIRPLLATPFDERNPTVSPDGRWLAYASNETGQMEVYVRGLEEGSGRTRISTARGAEPRWAHSGRELFYRTPDSVYAVPVTPGPVFRAGTPRALFGAQYVAGNPTNWDVAPDDRHFIVVRRREATTDDATLHVLLHWFDPLRAAAR